MHPGVALSLLVMKGNQNGMQFLLSNKRKYTNSLGGNSFSWKPILGTSDVTEHTRDYPWVGKEAT
jgi:hypothetical protein